MPASVSHVLSATTPDDPSFEIRPSHWNSLHALTLNLTGSEISNAFGNGGGVSFGLAGGLITAQAPAGAPSPINFSAGTTSSNIGSVVFADGNGISFGLNGSTITGTVVTNYLTTARRSTDAIGLATAQTNVTWTVNSAGLSFNAGGYAGTGFTTTTIAGAVVAGTHDTAGLKLAVPAYLTTAQPVGAYLTTARGSTDAIGLATAQTNVTWTVNSNGLSLNAGGYAGTGFTSTTTAGTAIVGTHNTAGLSVGVPAYITTARASTDAIGLATAQTNVTWTVNSAGLSFNAGGYAGTATGFTGANISGSMTHNTVGLSLSLSVAAPGGAASASLYALSNTTGASTSSNFALSALSINAYGILSVGMSNGSLQLSTPDPVVFTQLSVGNSNLGNTAGDTGVFTGRVVFVGSNNITLSGSSNGASQTISIIGGAGAGGGVALYDGANSISTGTARFTNANGVSFTFNGQTISGSVATTYRASNDAIGLNTAQTNVTWTVNSSGLSLNLPATSSLVGVNGVSVSTAGSTISVMLPYVSSYENIIGLASTAMTWGGTSISHAVAFNAAFPISASFLRIPALMTTNSTTIATMASATASAQGGLFSTINAVFYTVGTGASSQSLQSVASCSVGFSFSQKISVTNSTQASYSLGITGQANGASTTQTTQYSVSNTNYSFTTNQIGTAWSSGRFLDIPFASSIPAVPMWAVIGMSSSTSSAGAAGLAALTNCNVRYSNHYGAAQPNIGFGIMGSTNLTSGGMLGAGSFSTAGGGTTNSINISAISSIADNARIYFQLLRSA